MQGPKGLPCFVSDVRQEKKNKGERLRKSLKSRKGLTENKSKNNNLTYYLGPVVRIAMNSINWNVDTDTFREFHSVDDTSLHALPNITKSN